VLIAAFVVVLCWGLDVMILERWALETLWIRLAWAAAFALGALVMVKGSDRAQEITFAILGGTSVGALVALTILTEGSRGPLFGFFIATPFLATFMAPHRPVAIGVTGVAATIGSAVVLLYERAPLAATIPWVVTVAISGFLAVYSCRNFIHQQAAELEAARERARLDEELQWRARQTAEAFKLAHVQQLAAVGGLAAGVAHEIRNPLAAVKLNLSLLRETATGELAEQIADMEVAVDRITTITDDLTRAARRATDPIGSCDAHAAISDAVRLTTPRWKHTVEVVQETSDDPANVHMAEGRLVQVLSNLVLNACDALDETDEPKIRLQCRDEGDEHVLCVEDNGPGLDDDAKEQLFEPFFTTKDEGKGTGLGLFLCKTYVEQAAGTVLVGKSALGGAAFTIRLPKKAPARPSHQLPKLALVTPKVG